jgi:DNA-binding transcriptional regulator YiaG
MTARADPYTAEELRVWRARVRLTQSQMARLFHTSQRSISHWEAGAVPRDFSERFEKVLIAHYNVKTK